jgi:outer membrane immunogenic protein
MINKVRFFWRMSMKKLLLCAAAVVAFAAPAIAADLPARPYTKAPMIAPVALYNWSGCYVGGDAGGTWAKMNLNVPAYPFPDSSGTMSSFSGGVLGGCQYMTDSRFVFGIEGDYSWMNLDNTHLSGNGGTELFHVNYNQSASVRGRIGYSPMTAPNLLLYGTGGYAAADLNQSNYIPLAGGYHSGWASGWVAGVGAEWAFTANWIAGLEYLHAQYDRQSFVFLGLTNVTLRDTDTVRARLSYKFNWGGPVVAKY